MKKFIFICSLLLTCSAFAEVTSVFPTIWNRGKSVQVQVYNSTPNYVTCSGSIWITTSKNGTYSEHYFDSVMPRFTSYRTFQIRYFQDNIVHANHSIFCR